LITDPRLITYGAVCSVVKVVNLLPRTHIFCKEKYTNKKHEIARRGGAKDYQRHGPDSRVCSSSNDNNKKIEKKATQKRQHSVFVYKKDDL